jgi:hypothetical protein
MVAFEVFSRGNISYQLGFSKHYVRYELLRISHNST